VFRNIIKAFLVPFLGNTNPSDDAKKCQQWDTLPQGVLPSLRRRLKQLMRGKAMRSNTKARKRKL
jgi:hypothetical protein